MTPTTTVSARLDDLVANRALIFSGPAELLRADRPDQVRPLLQRVDDATRNGHWAVGWVAYDAAPAFLPQTPTTPQIDPALPLAAFWLTSPPAQGTALAELVADADQPSPDPAWPGRPNAGHTTGSPARAWSAEWSPEHYRGLVDEVREAIASGETYQANLTTRLTGRFGGSAQDWYTTLARRQRGSFHAFVHANGLGPGGADMAVVSASPERFFRWAGEELLCSPMKGTAARAPSSEADRIARDDLLSSPKERAENIMITDLVRNDLGRIAIPGTVEVTALLRPERFPTVWQLVSDVQARVGEQISLLDIFDALFPCGSITGAPKLRSTQILSELERRPRGLYCGAIGYVAPPGNAIRAEFNIAIRTAIINLADGTATYGVGSGITIDSEPAAEHAELLTKAKLITEPAPPQFGLIETLAARCLEGAPTAINLDAHLDRMQRSADYFDFTFDRAAIAAQVNLTVAAIGQARIRLELAATGQLQITTAPLPQPPAHPVRIALHTGDLVDPEIPWVHHKTTHRAIYDAARRAHPEADEVLLVNRHGQITEATTANVIIKIRGCWVTPPTVDGCLPGIERQRLLAAGSITERSLSVADVVNADEIALISSLRGQRAAALITDLPIADQQRP